MKSLCAIVPLREKCLQTNIIFFDRVNNIIDSRNKRSCIQEVNQKKQRIYIKNMILYKRCSILYKRRNFEAAPKSNQTKRLFHKCANSFSIPSKALLFLSCHTAHIRANGATLHDFCLQSFPAQLCRTSLTALNINKCMPK